jgi:hypothetical protein
MDTPKKLSAADLLSNNKAELNKAFTGGWMRVNTTIRIWNNRVRDEVIADQIAAQHGVTVDGAADVFKSLLKGADAELRAMNSALAAVRTRSYDVTKKLGRDYYVAPISDMPNVIKTLTEAKQNAEEKIDAFARTYSQRVAESLSQTGTLNNALEYPASSDVLAKIGVEVAFEPIPDMRTFEGMALPAEVAATFAAQVGNQQADLVTSMVTELYNDLVETTADLARYFGRKVEGEKGAKLYDTKIEKVRRLARQLESAQGIVNTDFSNLSSAVSELAEIDFEIAKVSPTVADTTAKLAKKINSGLNKIATQSEPPAPVNRSAPEAVTEDDVRAVRDEMEGDAHTQVDIDEILDAVEAEPEAEPKKPAADDPFAGLDSLFF